LSSWAKVKETFPDINTAPVAADTFINSLRFISFDINLTPFLLICESETPECLLLVHFDNLNVPADLREPFNDSFPFGSITEGISVVHTAE